MVVSSRHQRERSQVIDKVMRCCVAVMMLLFSAGACYLFYTTASLRIRGVETTATCVKISTHSRSDGRKTTVSTRLHLAFQTSSGESHESKVDASFTGVSQGQQVEIIYDPLQPSEVQVNQPLQIYGYPILLAVGMIFLFYSTFHSVRRIWKPGRS